MQFRIQFLDGSANVVGELTAAARNAAGALQLVVANDWPPEAVSIRVLAPPGARFIPRSGTTLQVRTRLGPNSGTSRARFV